MFAYFLGQQPTEDVVAPDTEDQADANTNDMPPGLDDRQRRQPMQTVAKDPEIVRKSHFRYVLRVYGTSLLLLVCACAQWALISYIFPPFRIFAIQHDYLGLCWLLLALLLLLATVVAFEKLKGSVKLLIVCTCVVAEMGSINVVRPILDAQLIEYAYASLGTGVVILISFYMSYRGKPCAIPYIEINRDFQSLVAWTAKIFVLSSLWSVVGLAVREPLCHATFALILSILLTIFVLMFGTTIGSLDFFKAEVLKAPLIAILSYFNFIALFANLLLLCQSIWYLKDSLLSYMHPNP